MLQLAYHYSVTRRTDKNKDGRYEKPCMSFAIEGSLDGLVVRKPGETPPQLGMTIHEDLLLLLLILILLILLEVLVVLPHSFPTNCDPQSPFDASVTRISQKVWCVWWYPVPKRAS